MRLRLATVALLLSWTPTGAHAAFTLNLEYPFVRDQMRVAAMLGGPPLVLGGLIIGAYNANDGLLKGRRPHWLALTSGYLIGTVNIAVGSFALALKRPQAPPNPMPILTAVGVTAVVVGALDLGLTIYANTRPRQPHQALSERRSSSRAATPRERGPTLRIAPLLAIDPDGHATLGAAMTLSQF
ncbi:MAG: hypothetical protein H6707_01925 [Deltaproteobacteria bacterium]|nr:hypothetical protein [Deltaproteobacteria bacterium]